MCGMGDEKKNLAEMQVEYWAIIKALELTDGDSAASLPWYCREGRLNENLRPHRSSHETR